MLASLGLAQSRGALAEERLAAAVTNGSPA
jgi:hypothetical protein